MKLAYVYVFNELRFDEENKFELDFSQNSELTNCILFSSKNDYYIVNMKFYIKINPDVAQSNRVKLIKELFDTAQELNSKRPSAFF